MSKVRKKIPARFYATADGREPVREWIKSLSDEDRRVLGKDVQKVEFGWPIGLPVCKPLGSGLWEVRSNLSSGRIGRIIFCIAKGKMVLLHGFVKKSQKTPGPALDLARKRKKEIES